MKMKSTRKVAGSVLSIVCAVSLISGCSSGKTGEPTATVSPAETVKSGAVATSPAKLDPVNLTIYRVGTPQPDEKAVVDAMNTITKEKINTTITLNTIDWGNYDDKMKVIISAGEDWDLTYTASWTNNFYNNVAKGAFLPLDDLLNKYGTHIKETIPAQFFDGARVNGKLYGITSYQIMATMKGFSIKKDLADKYKLDKTKIKSLRDLEPFLENVKQNEPGIVPTTSGAPVSTELLSRMDTGLMYDTVTGDTANPLVINVKNNDFKIKNLYELPETLELAKMNRDWYNKGYIRKDAATIKDYKAEQKTGKYGMFPAGAVKPGNEGDTKGWAGYDVTDVQFSPSYVSNTSLISSLAAINQNSKNPERAMMYLDLLFADKELYQLLCAGIDGKHYKKVDDRTIESLPNGGYNPGTDWEFGSQFNMFLRPGQPKDVWEQTNKVNKEAIVSPLIGFVLNRDPIKTEMAQIDAIIKQYNGVTNSLLNFGTAEPEKVIAEINDKLKKAGLDKVTAEAQKQLDEWRKANKK
jgi:putative aldouronate transport system substrate-binding protein